MPRIILQGRLIVAQQSKHLLTRANPLPCSSIVSLLRGTNIAATAAAAACTTWTFELEHKLPLMKSTTLCRFLFVCRPAQLGPGANFACSCPRSSRCCCNGSAHQPVVGGAASTCPGSSARNRTTAQPECFHFVTVLLDLLVCGGVSVLCPNVVSVGCWPPIYLSSSFCSKAEVLVILPGRNKGS